MVVPQVRAPALVEVGSVALAVPHLAVAPRPAALKLEPAAEALERVTAPGTPGRGRAAGAVD